MKYLLIGEGAIVQQPQIIKQTEAHKEKIQVK